MRVRTNRRTLTLGVAILSLGTVAQAIVNDGTNQYGNIAKRNVFGLKDPVIVTKQPIEQPPAPLPKITLTGIATITGIKMAFMRVAPPAKPGEAPKEDSVMLTEGQREGLVEVLGINEDAGAVRVKNAGTIMEVTFEKNGAKPPPSPALSPTGPGPAPAPPANQPVTQTYPSNAPPPPPVPMATTNPFAPQNRSNGAQRTIPGRTLRLPAPVPPPAAAPQEQPATIPAAPTVSLPQVPADQTRPTLEEELLKEIERQQNPAAQPAATIAPQ
jgi:hypothetical protein